MEPDAAPRPLLLYDGECGLCARSVRFVLARERGDELRFAALQSDLGKGVLTGAGLDPEALSSLVYVDVDGDVHTESGGALRVARHLRLPWRWGRVFLAVPPFLRDAVYRFIAERRYRWFGTSESCPLPTPAQSARFVG